MTVHEQMIVGVVIGVAIGFVVGRERRIGYATFAVGLAIGAALSWYLL